MAKQVINFGTAINDGTGDSLRLGAQKINSNFTELYNLLGGSESISIVTTITPDAGLATSSSSGDITIRALPATSTSLGSVKVGAGITVNEEGTISVATYTLPKAATNILGGIKVGNNLEIDNDGVLSAIASPYVLPTASPSVKGGVKVGTGLEIVDGVLSVSNTESATVLVNGASTVALEVVNEVNVLRSNFAVSLESQGNTESSSITWVDNAEDVGFITQVSAKSTGAEIIVGELGLEKTFTFNSSGILEFDSGVLIDPSDNNFEARGLNNFNVEATSVVNIYTDAQGNAYQWQFGDNGVLSTPAGLQINGDTTVQQATVDQLTADASLKSDEINGIQQQIGTKQSEMAYWQGVASQGPSNPQYGQALSSINTLSQEIGILQGSLNVAQGELNLIVADLNAATALLNNSSATLTYVVEDAVLNIDNGGIRFPDGSVQTTAFNTNSSSTIDSLVIGTEIIFNDLTVQKTAYNAVTPDPNTFEPFAPMNFFGISPSRFTWITDDEYSYRVSGSLAVGAGSGTNTPWFAFDPTKFNSGVLNIEVSFGRDLNGTTENRYVGTVNFGKVDVAESMIINASAQVLGLRETSLVTFNHILLGNSPAVSATIEQGSQSFPSIPVVAIAFNVPSGAFEENKVAYIKFSGTLFSVTDLGIESYSAGVIV